MDVLLIVIRDPTYRKLEHQPESRNIGASAETSARKQKHRRESGNIGARAETSA
ncbi:hypothetical protein ACW2QC_11235 [Virgibacillus sp. FSP13]